MTTNVDRVWQECYRCWGTGRYGPPTVYGGVCFQCNGRKGYYEDAAKVARREKRAAAKQRQRDAHAAGDHAAKPLKTCSGCKFDARVAARDASDAAFKAEFPDVAAVLFADNTGHEVDLPGATARDANLLYSLRSDLRQWGSLSEAQRALVLSVAERAAARVADYDAAADAPTGRVTVTGTVFATKWVETKFGETQKFGVQTTDGWKLWASVPKGLWGVERGDTVTLTVTVTPSDDDPKFGFGKRPTNAEFVSRKEEG